MEVEARDGRSRCSCAAGATTSATALKLTESDTRAGLARAPRAWSPEALERRVARDRGGRARRAAGSTATTAAAPPTASRPGRARVRALLRVRALRAARGAAAVAQEPAAALHRPRRGGQAARPRQRARRRRRAPTATFAEDVLGYRLYERIELDDGTEAGAWLSVTIAAHELIYTRTSTAPTAACTTSRSGSTRARSACARPTSSSTTASTIEAAPSKHAIAQGFFLYGFEPGGNRDRGHDRRLLRLRPRRAGRVWTRGRAREGPGLGRARRWRASTRTARRRSRAPAAG